MAIPTTAERARRKPAWATLAGNVALALLALVVALFLAELLLRLSWVSAIRCTSGPIRSRRRPHPRGEERAQRTGGAGSR